MSLRFNEEVAVQTSFQFTLKAEDGGTKEQALSKLIDLVEADILSPSTLNQDGTVDFFITKAGYDKAMASPYVVTESENTAPNTKPSAPQPATLVAE